MAAADSVLWLISYNVVNLCGLRSASVCWITSTEILQDTLRYVANTSGAEISL